jgi:hypothetical protein
MSHIKRTSFCSLAFLLITVSTINARSLAAPAAEKENNNASQTKARKRLHDTSAKRQVTGSRDSKRQQRTIIFVGGKKGRNTAAKSSNPRQAKKVNADLNPQPIPPGRQRHLNHALEAKPDNGNQQRATRVLSHRGDKRSGEVTSSDRRTSSVIACKQSCEEKYDNCVAAWVAKGRDRETGERRCGLGARSCKGRCDRNR